MTVQTSRWWALCRREWLEHRLALGWAPIGLLVLFVLAMSFTAAITNPSAEALSAFDLGSMLYSIVKPFTWLYLGAAILVLLASLVEERKDRTILFWKSMPVSDTQTVLSKLFVVCGIGALVSASVVICAQTFAVLLASLLSAADVSAATLVASSLVNWTCGYASQAFWLLPLWGWLLLVSSVARGLTQFWAAAIPAVVAFLEWVVFRTDHFITSALRHLDLRALPTHIGEHSSAAGFADPRSNDISGYLPQLAELWVSGSMWLGIVTGGLLVAAAIFFRSRNNEL